MAIATQQVITYADLVNSVVNKIASYCQNVDGYSSSVPSELKPGYSYRLQWTNYANATFTVQSSEYLNTVSKSTIISQLNSFLASRGLSNKAGTIVTIKGMMNFYANVAVFLGCRIVTISSNKTTTTCLFYYSGSVTYPSVTNSGVTTVGVTASDAQSNLDSLITSISASSRIYTTKYSIGINSCCSCSSSSCSSSSCSSSSFFIAFMLVK